MDTIRRVIIIISCIVLAGAGVVGFMFALDKADKKTDQNQSTVLSPDTDRMTGSTKDPSSTSAPETREYVSTTLVVLVNQDNEAELVFVAGADYANNKIRLIFFPVDTSTTVRTSDNGYKYLDLASIYKDSDLGLKKLAEAVEGMLGVPMKGTAAVSFDTFSKLYLSFTSRDRDKTVTYYPPCTVKAYSVDGSYVNIEKKKSSLTISETVDLLRFYMTKDDRYDSLLSEFYDGSRYKQNLVAATLIKEIIVQKMVGLTDSSKSYYAEGFSDFFADIVNKPLSTVDYAPGFPESLSKAQSKMNSDSVEIYVIAQKADEANGQTVYAESVNSVTNDYGNIETKRYDGDLKAFLRSLY